MSSGGNNVPDDPTCIGYEYLDSRVIEYYQTEAEREARFSQLVALGRKPMSGYAYETKIRLSDVYSVRWQEPRGEGLDAIRTGS